MNTPVQKSSGANQPVADAVVVETVVDEPKRLSASNDPRTEPFEINEASPRRWGWLLPLLRLLLRVGALLQICRLILA